MIRLAFQSNLRVICPIRAGYAESDRLGAGADVFAATASDTAFLLKHLNIARLPYAVQGSDFPFAVDFIARHPGLISALIGIGGRPCLPGGVQIEGAGRWQRFFLWAARNNPSLVQFASNAVMSMSWNIGPEAMLRQLCKDSPADLAILENEEMREILAANIQLIARGSANAAGAFAMEYVAFQDDWSGRVLACRNIPVHVSIAAEDPTLDVGSIPDLQTAYPWMSFTIIPNAGLALMYQKYEELIPLMATTARDASKTQSEV